MVGHDKKIKNQVIYFYSPPFFNDAESDIILSNE